jgi:hypothetical protein
LIYAEVPISSGFAGRLVTPRQALSDSRRDQMDGKFSECARREQHYCKPIKQVEIIVTDIGPAVFLGAGFDEDSLGWPIPRLRNDIVAGPVVGKFLRRNPRKVSSAVTTVRVFAEYPVLQ